MATTPLDRSVGPHTASALAEALAKAIEKVRDKGIRTGVGLDLSGLETVREALLMHSMVTPSMRHEVQQAIGRSGLVAHSVECTHSDAACSCHYEARRRKAEEAMLLALGPHLQQVARTAAHMLMHHDPRCSRDWHEGKPCSCDFEQRHAVATRNLLAQWLDATSPSGIGHLVEEVWANVPREGKARFMEHHPVGVDPVRIALRERDALRQENASLQQRLEHERAENAGRQQELLHTEGALADYRDKEPK